MRWPDRVQAANGIPIDEMISLAMLAFNMLPLLPDREGGVREGNRIVDEVRKILRDDGVMISAVSCGRQCSMVMREMVRLKRSVRCGDGRRRARRFPAVKISYCQKRDGLPAQVGDAPDNPQLSIGYYCASGTVCWNKFGFWSVADNVNVSAVR